VPYSVATTLAAGSLIMSVLHSKSRRTLTAACWHAGDAELVDVQLYGEALCPYCMRFTTTIVAPLLKQGVGSILNFTCESVQACASCLVLQGMQLYAAQRSKPGTCSRAVCVLSCCVS
jgi:hypothetical protein